jgi:hypothetical protein
MPSLLLIAASAKQLTPLRDVSGTAYTRFTATSQDEPFESLQLTMVPPSGCLALPLAAALAEVAVS